MKKNFSEKISMIRLKMKALLQRRLQFELLQTWETLLQKKTYNRKQKKVTTKKVGKLARSKKKDYRHMYDRPGERLKGKRDRGSRETRDREN